VVFVASVLAFCAAFASVGHAHKPITSKYTYNDDVFPILRNRCARCHVTGGVAPMSLMTYEDAFPWAESIRAELIAAHMPPWQADDAFGGLKGAHTLSPQELDVILTWASGGNPRGALDQRLPAVSLANDWTLGAPDLQLPTPAAFEFAADKMDDIVEFTIATDTAEPRWVRAVDLLPGTPSIVRSATISLKPDAAPRPTDAAPPEQILGRWLPGQDPEPSDGAIARLPAGARLDVRIHYKKTWQFEGKPMRDRSAIGIYFAKGDLARQLLTVPLASPALAASAGSTQRVSFTRTLEQDVQALAVSPDIVPPNITLEVEAVRPDGSRAPMIRLNTRADWNRRYWFDKPLILPRGSTINVAALLRDPDLMSTAFAAPNAAAADAGRPLEIRLALDVVPAGSKPAAP
jgi:hypothetical protein